MEQIKKPIIIKDLGLLYAHPTSRDKKRYLLIECPTCFERRRKIAYDIERGCNTECRSCTKKRTGVTHGLHKHSLYSVWEGVKQRCANPKEENFKYYGGRGIAVCDEWKNDFKAFFDWAIENGWEDGLTIDRVDSDGNYEPSNCRWTTRMIQMRNTRRIRKNNTSGYKGVTWDKNRKRWMAQITYNYKNIHLGRFIKKIEAALHPRKNTIWLI